MKNKKRYSQISQRIFIRYILSFLILFLILFGGFFLAWFICSRFIWYESNPAYHMLKALQSLSPFIIALTVVICFFIFTYRTIRRPLIYLDDVIDAAKSLSSPTDSPITLPDDLSDIQNQLNLTREQALRNIILVKEAESRKNDLIMYLAHDLKTPLSSVIGYLNLLRDEKEISEELRQKYMSVALDKAERLEELINEFFEIARFNLSNITLQYSNINLTMMLEQLAYEFAPMLKDKNLTCTINVDNNSNIMLRCDADKIERVFDNLLRNAVIYSYNNSNITIEAIEYNYAVVITFINEGDTISQEKLGRIFEQFYRLDSSRGTSCGGAGLGLAIAKQIVELHHGEISAHSRNNIIKFSVTLPIS